MEYAVDNLLDEEKCYAHLLEYFHDGELTCSCCSGSKHHVHHYRRKPVLQFKCEDCGTYFNIFTGTALQGTHWKCSKIVMVLRGFIKGDSTLSMSKEMGLGYRNLLYLRHDLMKNAFDNRELDILPDKATESDEMYQNSGEKGLPHLDIEDPPRRRANKKRGSEPGKTTVHLFTGQSVGRVAKFG